MPLDPQEFVPSALNVHASSTNGVHPPAKPLHPALSNTTENPEKKWNLQQQVHHPNNSAMLLPVSLNIISL